MTRPVKWLKKWCNRETIAYAVFGVATTLVNLLMYRLLLAAAVDYKISNLLALLASKLFAYVANKKFVFQSRTNGFAALIKEFFRFVLARGATALVDYFGLILLVEWAGMNNRMAKYLVMAVVIILNYFLGKKLVFTAGRETSHPDPSPPPAQDGPDRAEPTPAAWNRKD